MAGTGELGQRQIGVKMTQDDLRRGLVRVLVRGDPPLVSGVGSGSDGGGAILIAGLEKRPEIASALNASFERMLARYREVQETTPELAPRPKPRPKRDFRRRKR